MRRVRFAVALAAAGLGLGVASATADPVAYTYSNTLTNSTLQTITGSPDATGGCTFAPPVLSRTPGGPAMEERQVSTNFANCTSVVETGQLSSDQVAALQADTSLTSQSSPIDPFDSTSTSTNWGSGQTSTHSFNTRVTWFDLVNLRVNWTQSDLTYTKNSSCITSASGYGEWWWFTLTSWLLHSSSTYINAPQCSYRKVYTSAEYWNLLFCPAGTVKVFVKNVTSAVTIYAETGFVERTYEQNVPFCPALHWSLDQY